MMVEHMLSVFAYVDSFQHANGEKQAASAWISVFQVQSDSGPTLLFEQQSTHVQVMRTQQHVRTHSQPQATTDAHNTPILCVYTAAQPMMTMMALHQAYAVKPVLPCATKWPSSELHTRQSCLAIPAVTGLQPVA